MEEEDDENKELTAIVASPQLPLVELGELDGCSRSLVVPSGVVDRSDDFRQSKDTKVSFERETRRGLETQ